MINEVIDIGLCRCVLGGCRVGDPRHLEPTHGQSAGHGLGPVPLKPQGVGGIGVRLGCCVLGGRRVSDVGDALVGGSEQACRRIDEHRLLQTVVELLL